MSEKVMVISGCVSGIGLAAAEKFAKSGYAIVMVDIKEDQGKQAEKQIKRINQNSTFYLCDISKYKDLKSVGEIVKDVYGRVDVLINNASIERKGSILQCKENDWDQTIGVNLRGISNMSQTFIPYIIDQGGGSVINTGSILGRVAVSNYACYSASKGAINSLTKSMAFDLAQYNIRVNCVAPGVINTPRLRDSINSSLDPIQTEIILNSKCILNRMGRPDEVSNVMYFLASEEATFITGATFNVDGGWSI